MAPAWQQLGETFNAETSSVLIADVDCSAEGKDLCEQFSVRGYPTIKFFVDGDEVGSDYKGGRDFDSLKAFVQDVLEIQCNIQDPKECSDKEKSYLEKFKAKTSAERQSQIERLSKMHGETMKAELKQWVTQRLRILKALESSGDEL